MEYFLTTLITSIILFIFFKNLSKLNRDMPVQEHLSQSKLFIKSPIKKAEKPLDTQAIRFLNSRYARVVFVDGKAYWIANNSIYTAKSKNNKIDENTIETVDIMPMNKVELDKMIFIVDKLTEGNENDSRNSGK